MSEDSDNVVPFTKKPSDDEDAPLSPVAQKLFKIRKKLSSTEVEELEALTSDQELRDRIARCEANVEESERARDNDDDLKDLKQQAKDAAAPYRDAIKHQRLIAKYATLLRETRGKV